MNLNGFRLPATVIICGGLLFILYIFPWNELPSPPPPPPPSSRAAFMWQQIVTSSSSSSSREQQQHHNNSSSSSSQTISILLKQSKPVPGLVSYSTLMNSSEPKAESTPFNASQNDVMVLLHMQKTGGTAFEKHVVQDLDLDEACVCWKRRKRCKCARPSLKKSNSAASGKSGDPWLFSRFSTGWICGLHADWTELTTCVNPELEKAYGSHIRRRYFYITMIRDPVHRFLSEFRHVQRGATWKASRHVCDGRYATAEELGSCYSGRSWTGVNLHDFVSCPHNLAFNRQTRMLADLTLVGCYNRSYIAEVDRNSIMLASAKHNLELMAFVGLTEQQKMSQYVFEETFNMKFKSPFTQNVDTFSTTEMGKLNAYELATIRNVNKLDLELYAFAEQLLYNRFTELKGKDEDFDDHYAYLGETKGQHFSWDEIENGE